MGLLSSVAARMARARRLGFDTGRPVFHGSNADFRAFDLRRGGFSTGARAGREGIWLAHAPQVADEFAARAAADSGRTGSQTSFPVTYPLFVRRGRRAHIPLNGKELDHEISATLAQARDEGYDSVILTGYLSPNGLQNQTIEVVFDPKNIRSAFARFDPKKSDSSDLLASLGIGAGIAGGGLLARARGQARA